MPGASFVHSFPQNKKSTYIFGAASYCHAWIPSFAALAKLLYALLLEPIS